MQFVVRESMPGIEVTPKTAKLAYRLQFYLDCKDNYFYVLDSLLKVFTIDDMKVNKLELEEELSFFSVDNACMNFKVIDAQKNEKRGQTSWC